MAIITLAAPLLVVNLVGQFRPVQRLDAGVGEWVDHQRCKYQTDCPLVNVS